MTSQTSFRQNSFWTDAERVTSDQRVSAEEPDRLNPEPKTPYEDWVDRLRDMADEAGDNELLALESDILDLRDEISDRI